MQHTESSTGELRVDNCVTRTLCAVLSVVPFRLFWFALIGLKSC